MISVGVLVVVPVSFLSGPERSDLVPRVTISDGVLFDVPVSVPV